MAGIRQWKAGGVVNEQRAVSILSTPIQIPDPDRVIHLQFRRFAGCPICDLHLHSVVRRHHELAAACIREIVVFHSSAEDLLPYCEALPFDTIADPGKQLYGQFGVESGLRSLLSPRAWTAILRGVLRSSGNVLLKRTPLPPLYPKGGRLGLPADFLIAPDGAILACKYGSHAYDQWTVDEILELARAPRRRRIS